MFRNLGNWGTATTKGRQSDVQRDADDVAEVVPWPLILVHFRRFERPLHIFGKRLRCLRCYFQWQVREPAAEEKAGIYLGRLFTTLARPFPCCVVPAVVRLGRQQLP